MDSTQTASLSEIPCAQAYNSWNKSHQAHDWLAKDRYPFVDAHCPGSVLVRSDCDPVDIADEMNGVFEY